MSDKKKKTALEAAYAFLASRMRTKYEVEKHLADKGYDKEETLEALSELTGLRYIDDYQYALRYYEYNREKGRGSERAARELTARGVDADTVRNAREDYLCAEGVDEYFDALAAAEKELRLREKDLAGEPDESAGVTLDDKAAARIARKLDGKGFGRGVIFRVLDELRSRHGDTD